MADHNVRARWREHVNKSKLLGQEIPGSLEYLDEPRFFDHSRLEALNRRAISLGIDPTFDDKKRMMVKCSCQNVTSIKRRETRLSAKTRRPKCAIAAIVKRAYHPSQQSQDFLNYYF
jgi:hypothetical protein